MAINKVADRDFRKTAHANYMGGLSYDITNPVDRLRMAAASCFFGEPQYYRTDKKPAAPRDLLRYSPHTASQLEKLIGASLTRISPSSWTGLGPTALMEKAIDEALDFDPEATLILASLLRNEDNIRTTPQVIMVRAANHPKVRGSGLISKYADQIIRRPDELATQLAYQLSYKGAKAPIPNSLKRAWRAKFEVFTPYQLAKYRMESREVKLVDVANLVHPKSDAVNDLVRGNLKTTDQTWEAIRSSGGTWTEALDVMGHMALLRNLRNLLQAGVPEDEFCRRLVDGAATGKQLPFRYYSAYKAVESLGKPKTMDAIESALEVSLVNLPRFPGRTISLCDNSGSAWGATTSSMGTMAVAEIANLSGVLTGKVSDDGYVGVFGDRLDIQPVRKRSSVFDQLKDLEKRGKGIGQSTENGIWLFWDKAIKEKQHWDHVFVYSDMQAGHGGLYGIDPAQYSAYKWGGSRNIDVPKLISEYRRQVNPNVKVFLVQVAGYQDTIVPEFYKDTYILGGWSDGVLRFAAKMSGLTQPELNDNLEASQQ